MNDQCGCIVEGNGQQGTDKKFSVQGYLSWIVKCSV